jgi:DNA-binding GntR family transcriptional regulator
MDVRTLHRVSVADQVVAVLRQKILEGEIRPGAPLQEIPLASSLGVSRNTMREALRVLSLEGLLKRNIHRGVTVAELSLKDVREIYQLRHLLEVSAVLAGKKAEREVFEQLGSLVEQYERAARARDWVSAVAFDLQFHGRLISFHQNRRLETFYQKVLGELRVGMVLVDRSHDDPETLIRVHRKLFQLLSAGKFRESATLLGQHLKDSEARLIEVMNGGRPERSARKAERD